MEAVLDSNIAVSAAISPKGPPAELIRAWRAQSFVWVTSPPLLEELSRVLHSRHVKRYLSWTNDELEEFLLDVQQSARIVVPAQSLDVIKDDPTDNRVLEAAIEAHAGYIVSGDRDLLDLKEYEGVQIVTPARFVAILAASSS